jgi:hypothetical protein
MGESPHIDDGTAAEQHDEDDEVPMNAKGGFGQAVLAGVIVAVATLVIHRTTDSSDERALATLTERVSNLSDQVRKLSEQPYATRSDFAGVESRLSGIDTRLRDIERTQLQRRER